MNKIIKNQGFTLIELVVVIVILGILSAAAVPKFINLKKEAIVNSMKSLVGTMQSVSHMVYLKSAISAVQESPSATITIDGEEITVIYGYPAGTKDGIVKMIESNTDAWNISGDLDTTDDGDWHSRASTYTGAWVYWHGSYDENAGSLKCYIRYRQATNTTAPTIDIETTDCR